MKQRCFFCKKKHLMTNECKCKNIFCLTCLPYYIHNCSYDYKKEKQKILQEDNVKIEASKVDKI